MTRILFVVALLAAAPTRAAVLTAHIFGVSDGETITALDAAKPQRKIRLAAIDAPEKGQPFGSRSKANLSRLAFGNEVRIEWTTWQDSSGVEKWLPSTLKPKPISYTDRSLDNVQRGFHSGRRSVKAVRCSADGGLP